MDPLSQLFQTWHPFENQTLEKAYKDIWNLIFKKLNYQDCAALKLTCRSFCILLSRPPWNCSPTHSALQSGVCKLLTTSNKHFNFIPAQESDEITIDHDGRIRKISKTSVGNQIEDHNQFLMAKGELHFKDFSVYIGGSSCGSFYRRRGYLLDTMKKFRPLSGDSFRCPIIISSNQIRIAYINGPECSISLAQYKFERISTWYQPICAAVQYVLTYLGKRPREEEYDDEYDFDFFKEWSIEYGQLRDTSHFWFSNNQNHYCFTTNNAVYLLSVNPAALVKCNTPELTGEVTDKKSVGNRLLLLIDKKRLVTWCCSPDKPNEFESEWSNNIGEHHRIERAVSCAGRLCVEFSCNHGWVHHDGWGEDDGYDAISRTLVIIDLIKGKMIYSTPLLDKQTWNAGGNILLEYKVRTDWNPYFNATDLRTMESLRKVTIPTGIIWDTHIQKDNGAILFHTSENGQHKIYELSPKN
jgi:hypothetical protein